MQTVVAMSRGFGDIHVEDDGASVTDYPMSLIILYAILDHIKPGTAEIRQILTNYIRSPPPHEDAGNALEEVIRWKRAHRQARAISIETLSPSEYLDSFMGIIRPLTRHNRILNTLVSNMEAHVEFNGPSDTCVKECEDKLINNIK